MRIEVENLTYIYSKGMPFETTAFEDISFTVEAGEFVCLIGHTGSGKSTLIQHLNGLIKATGGKVLADGVDISLKSKEAKTLRNKIGMVFQYPEYQLFEETVLKDVCYGPKNLGYSAEEAEAMAKSALALVNIPEEKFGASPFSLSGGEKRRVAIAGVLAMNPEVLILDEPTAGLDPVGHDDILSMIRRIREERSLSIVLVSHNMDDAAELSDKIVVMNSGKLELCGSPREVFAHAELLEEIGLGLPGPGRLLRLLKSKGLNVNTELIYKEEAAEEIAKAVHGS